MITEKTKISIALVITIVGGIFWLSTIYARGETNSKGIDELKTEKVQLQRDLSEIKSDVSAIKQSVKNIEEKI